MLLVTGLNHKASCIGALEAKAKSTIEVLARLAVIAKPEAAEKQMTGNGIARLEVARLVGLVLRWNRSLFPRSLWLL